MIDIHDDEIRMVCYIAIFKNLLLCNYIYTSPQPYLVFSTWFTVSHMNLDGSDYSVLVDSSDNSGPRSVDYHWR